MEADSPLLATANNVQQQADYEATRVSMTSTPRTDGGGAAFPTSADGDPKECRRTKTVAWAKRLCRGVLGEASMTEQFLAVWRFLRHYRVWSRPLLVAMVVALPQSLHVWPTSSTPAWLTFAACCLSFIPLDVLFEPAVRRLFVTSHSLVFSILSQLIFDGPINTLVFAAALSTSHGEDFLKYFTVGAVLCNALFVTGASLIVGGAAARVAHFRSRRSGRAVDSTRYPVADHRVVIHEATSRSYGLLLLAAVFFMLPTLFVVSHTRDVALHNVHTTSRVTAFVMILLYVAMAIFQKFTDPEELDHDATTAPPSAQFPHLHSSAASCCTTASVHGPSETVLWVDHSPNDDDDDDDDDELCTKPEAPVATPAVVLAVDDGAIAPESAAAQPGKPEDLEGVGALVAFLLVCAVGIPIQLIAMLLLRSLHGAAAETDIPWQWLAAVPTVLASSAHTMSDAWSLSYRGRVDHALTNVASSSVQSLMLVFPMFMIAAWVIKDSLMDLNLPVMLGAVLILASVVTANVMGRRHATWLEGAMLVALYAIVCAYIGVAVWLDDHDAGATF